MAHTAHKDKEMMHEHMDAPEVLETKLRKLDQMIRESRHIVVFTGAGISTSAGISDFRGPMGVWTRKAQGQAPIAGTSTVKALPTKTHMGIVELHRRGILRYVISQNCDGLHRRSGLPASAISELHGNSNIEICETCGRRFFRDYKAVRKEHTFDHFTGRFCICKGRLLESTIDFGQNLPRAPLVKAQEESEKADLHIVFGSSLTVSPACDMPRSTAENGGKLVIVNLQKTPLTPQAALQVHAPTDVVMESLMQRLGIPIPNFRLERRIIFGLDGDEVFAKAVDVHAPDRETGVLCAVDWDGTMKEIHESQRTQAIWKSLAHRHTQANLDISQLRPTLYFVGHYQEPPLTLDIDLTVADKDVSIAFDPSNGRWEVASMQSVEHNSSAVEGVDQDCEYGASHREYVISKRREQGSTDAAKQVDEEFLKARQRAEWFADEDARDRARNRACAILMNHKKVEAMLSDSRVQTAMNTPIEVDPTFGSKVPCDKGEGHFKKIPTSEHQANMTNHTHSCKYDGCRNVWHGPWGSFIGGARGRTHFDLSECPEGKRLNQVIGWNYDVPAC
jgi:NAD-dependent SIR2 family protein deacetylase